MPQEAFRHHEGELAQQSVEVAAGFDNGSLPDQDDRVYVEKYAQPGSHHIEIKGAHACSADCPEHGDHDHEGHGHRREHGHHHEADRKHTVVQKLAEHACDADCPEHSASHNREKSQGHEGREARDHQIESKLHVCVTDCPEHNHLYEDGHTHESHDNHQPHSEGQSGRDHHIEHKPHACGADCPEHGVHSNSHSDLEQKERNYDGALAYQDAEEGIRRFRQAEAQTTEREASMHDSKAQERATEGNRPMAPTFEAGRTIQNEPQAPGRQLEREERIAELSVVSEVAIIPEVVAETSAESASVFDAVTSVESRPEVETPHDLIDQNAEIAVDMQLPAVEIVSLHQTPVNSIIEQKQSSDAQEFNREAGPTAYSEMFDDTDIMDIEIIEPLENIGIEPVELPTPQPAQLEQYPEEVYNGAAEGDPRGMSAVTALAAELERPKMEQGLPDSKQAAEELAEFVSKRIELVARRTPADAPLRELAIQKTLRTLAELQAAPENVEARQHQLLRLLRLLGYENPAQALSVYIHQYGDDFVCELQAKLFELLSQGRVYESLLTSSHSSPALPANDTSALGTLVLALAQLRGYLSAVASST